MHNPYAIKVQVIRSEGRNDRFYVVIPMPLAAAISLQQGEEIYWMLIDKETLQMKRRNTAKKLQKIKTINTKNKKKK